MPIPRPCVVDTNVAVVANRKSKQADDALEQKCIEALDEIRQHGGLVLDSDGLIVEEYVRNLNRRDQQGVGYSFLLWVFVNQANPVRCEQRTITPVKGDRMFAEFPDDEGLRKFDRSDRKFVAVANAGEKRPILQAVDFKWWGWSDALAGVGIQVVFLDEKAARAGYRKHANRA